MYYQVESAQEGDGGGGTSSHKIEGSQRGGLVQASELMGKWGCGETPGVGGGKGEE